MSQTGQAQNTHHKKRRIKKRKANHPKKVTITEKFYDLMALSSLDPKNFYCERKKFKDFETELEKRCLVCHGNDLDSLFPVIRLLEIECGRPLSSTLQENDPVFNMLAYIADMHLHTTDETSKVMCLIYQ